MNTLFQRIFKQNFVDRRLISPLCKHYQLDIMREQIHNPIIILLSDFKQYEPKSLKKPKLLKPVRIPDGVRTTKLVIPGPPKNEFSFLNKFEMESARKMNESFTNRLKIPIKKPIITPNGIRIEKLVIPGPPKNEFNCL